MALASREDRGLEIAKSATITENADGSFSVPSQSIPEIVYLVKVMEGRFTCNCPDYVQRHEEIETCKHGVAVRLWIAARTEIQAKPRPKVFSEDAVQCPKCGSIRVVKFGNYNGKQLYKCKDCKTKFREGLIKRTKYSPETITLTLDLYFSGLSLRKISRTVSDHFDINLAPMTIYRWIQRFVPRVSEYVNSLTPELSDTWHADEVFLNMKGGEMRKVGLSKEEKSIAYLWNVMDRKTRFLLASRISKRRDVVGADGAFREAFRNAKGRPEKVFVDGLNSYKMAFAGFPENVRPELIVKAGIKKPHANNNRIERLNGTVRERTKVQRGWKNMNTPLAEGFRIQYNFVKPHQALRGQTPAERAGVGVQGKDKWLAMLTEAITRDVTGGENHP